jgi:hypothetical protein
MVIPEAIFPCLFFFGTWHTREALTDFGVLYHHHFSLFLIGFAISINLCNLFEFFDDSSTHKDKPTSSIRQWLNSYKTLILQSMKDAKTKSLSHVRTLDHYVKVP